MVASFFATESMTRLRAPLVEDHGAMIRDWSDEDAVNKLVIDGVDIQAGSGQVNTDNGQAVLAVYTVIVPFLVDVVATDRLRLPMGDFALVMEPQIFKHSTGYDVVLHLERWADQVG